MKRFVSRQLAFGFFFGLAAVAVAATAYTGTEAGLTDWLGAVSGWAAAFAGPVLVLTTWRALDYWVIDELDTWGELADDNRAVAIFVGAVLIAFSICFLGAMIGRAQPAPTTGADPPTAHVDTASEYVGVTERPPNSNEGPAVERFLAAVDLGPGYPYCAAAASAWAKWAGVKGPVTTQGEPIRTALATDFLDSKCTIDAGAVLSGKRQPPPGSLVIWRKGNSIYGHAGVVTGDEMSPTSRTRWYGRCGRTIEANTTSPDGVGSQREGGGVWRRQRCIRPHSYFKIVAFVPPSC